MDGEALKSVDVFNYLGSSINFAANLDDEVLNCVSNVSQAFGRLHTHVWQERGIKVNIKLDVCKAVVLSSLLYECETWTCYRRHIKKLKQFHLRCLHKILHFGWDTHIPNQEFIPPYKNARIEAHLKKAQLRWCGHGALMENYHLPKEFFFAELSQGKRHMGDQKKRYKDTPKASVKTFSAPTARWLKATPNRVTWRATINKGTIVFERDRLQSLDEKCMAKKNRVIKECCKLPQMQQNLRITIWSSGSHAYPPALTVIFDNEGPPLVRETDYFPVIPTDTKNIHRYTCSYMFYIYIYINAHTVYEKKHKGWTCGQWK